MVTGETGGRTGPCMRCARGACMRRLWAQEGVGNGVQLVCGSCWGRHLWGTQGGLYLAVGYLVKTSNGRETELFTVKVILTSWQFGLKITFSPIRKKAITGTEQFTSCESFCCVSQCCLCWYCRRHMVTRITSGFTNWCPDIRLYHKRMAFGSGWWLAVLSSIVASNYLWLFTLKQIELQF